MQFVKSNLPNETDYMQICIEQQVFKTRKQTIMKVGKGYLSNYTDWDMYRTNLKKNYNKNIFIYSFTKQ